MGMRSAWRVAAAWWLTMLPLTAIAGDAGAEKKYAPTRLTAEPAIDGKAAGDAAWDAAAVETGLTVFESGEAPARKTQFRAGYTEKAFFIGVECEEPETGKLKASEPDMGQLWGEDSIELFILPSGSDAYYQFIVNAAGKRYNGLGGVSGVQLPLLDWQAKTSVSEKGWTLEVKIPWEVMKKPPAKDDSWGFNLCRNVAAGLGRVDGYTWARVKKSFHDPENFGRLVFGAGGPTEPMEIGKKAAGNPGVKVLTYSRPMGCKGDLGTFVQVGASKRRVSFVQGAHVSPRLCPDGKTMLLHSNEGGKTGIWLLDRDGGNLRRVCDGSSAEWSPDGKRMVFVREGKVFERVIETGEEKVVSPEAWTGCRFAAYSREGTLAVKSGEGGQDEMYLIGLKGDAPRLLVKGDIPSAPKCSPDGKAIAYQNGAHIHLLDLKSGVDRQLTLGGGIQGWPVWSADGKSIYFSQRVDVFERICEIWSVHVDDAGNIGLVQKDVNASFDWNGIPDGPAEKHAVGGNTLSLWQSKTPYPASDDWKKAVQTDDATVSPKVVAPNQMVGKTIMPVAQVWNDWFFFSLSALGEQGSAILLPNANGNIGQPIEIVMRTTGTKDAPKIRSIVVARHDGECTELKLTYASRRRGQKPEALVTVFRTGPGILLAPPSGWVVSVKAEMSALVAPDRYANDLVLRPDGLQGQSVALPHEPFYLGCVTDGSGLLAAGSNGDAAVITGKAGETFEGLEIRADEVLLAPLVKPFWQRLPVKAAEGGGWSVEWAPPYTAQWRVAASNKEKRYSRVWDGSVPAGALPEQPDTCVMYAYGRAAGTPPGLLMIDDILRTVLGTRDAEDMLDDAGVRGWRSADEWTPCPEIFTQPHGWSPTLVHTKPGDLGILETMMGIRGVDVEPVRALTRHLGEDVLNILKGLDKRITEYQAFGADAKKRCAAGDAETAALLAPFAARIKEVENRLAETKCMSIKEVQKALGYLIDGGLKKERYLYTREEYKQFSTVTRAALSERQQVIAAWREAAKLIRDEASLATAKSPKFKKTLEALRETARTVLRNRYYLEGDWRGEKPLEGGSQ